MWRAHSRGEGTTAVSIAARPASVEVGRQRWIEPVLVEPLDLRGEHPASRQRRQRAHREELDRVGLAARSRIAAFELADEEQLVDVMHPRGMRVAVLVDERGELHGTRLVTGLLEDLARHRL